MPHTNVQTGEIRQFHSQLGLLVKWRYFANYSLSALRLLRNRRPCLEFRGVGGIIGQITVSNRNEIIVTAIFLWIALSWVLAYRLRSEVDARLDPPERSEVWPSWEYWDMLQRHRELYPKSRLRLAAYLCHLGSLVLFLVLIFSHWT